MDLNRSFWGMSAKYGINNYLFSNPVSTIIGVDISYQHDMRLRLTPRGERGSKVFDQLESFRNMHFIFNKLIY